MRNFVLKGYHQFSGCHGSKGATSLTT